MKKIERLAKKIILGIDHFFKKMRWLDIVAMSVFMFILGVAFFFFLRQSKYVDVVVAVSDSDNINLWFKPPVWYLENVKPGMEQKDLLGRRLVYVKDTNTYSVNSQNKVFYATLSLMAVYNKRSNEYSYEGIPLLIGSYQTFRVNGIKITGVLHSVGDVGLGGTKKRIIVTGYLKNTEDKDRLAAETMSDGVETYISKNFVEGLTIKNNKGNVVFKVDRVNKMPATRRFINGDRLIYVNDPERERVELTGEMEVKTYNDVMVFMEDNYVAINSNVWLDFTKFASGFVITSIEDAK
jgi:hypothetical protein